jgi:FkbM family methyltransferase
MWREAGKDGSYQRDHFDVALSYVTDKRCAVDAGAHVGTWAWLMARHFSRVIAVEPADDTFECLKDNMRRFELANVEPVHVALGAKQGRVSLVLDAKQTARRNTGGRYVSAAGGTIRCETIDDWDLRSLGFLKLDIEGSEPDAIIGGALTLQRCKPVVLFEDKGFCTRLGHAKDATQTLLAGLGYVHRARVGHDEIWTVAS